LIEKGHLVIIASYARYEEAEVRDHEPRVILVDQQNHAHQPSRMARAK
jgi:aspartate 1-decarboxylase